MNSERVPIFAAFALSLVLNTALFFSVDSPIRASATKWQPPKALSASAAYKKARKIEIEFVEAPPQKPIRRPERTKKVAARDSLAQDLSKLKTTASLAPAVAKLGPSDQLSQLRMEDRPVMPLRAPQPVKPELSLPKEPALEPVEKSRPDAFADPKSWLPISAATTEKKLPDPEKKNQERAEDKAMEQAAMTLTSRDKITTMEMAVKRSSGAPFQGVTSFEATGSGMGAYMKNLKDNIWLQWFPYIAFRYPLNFETADAVVRFTIGKNGEVRRAEVDNYHGNPLFATFCMQVVRASSGFGPLPKDLLAMMGKDELEIKFAFHYR